MHLSHFYKCYFVNFCTKNNLFLDKNHSKFEFLFEKVSKSSSEKGL